VIAKEFKFDVHVYRPV